MAANDDVSLPKATVNKLIREMLPNDIKCANETRDLIVECCVEFIHLLSSEANEVCSSDKKKTISPEHIIKALETLGFQNYVESVQEVYEEHKEQSKEKSRGIKKLNNQGIPDEVLESEQQQLFERARSALRNSQLGIQVSGGADSNELTDSGNEIHSGSSIVLSSYQPDASMDEEEDEEDDYS